MARAPDGQVRGILVSVGILLDVYRDVAGGDVAGVGPQSSDVGGHIGFPRRWGGRLDIVMDISGLADDLPGASPALGDLPRSPTWYLAVLS